ncbi:unnamed protein product [Aspergillus oryzae]|uniref:Unnamed protein product n=2 Tax=Aspergillus oryzae TaxID=5062 RepID=A0AAN5C138_ASPOZ|nr:unnamed protein product [Aspergillus oryzae]GMF96537.1 unnamed protein product [Aspergillus oryzae]GMG07683.1 unnamed protein product [Aspergillus oryzae]GMG35229.1 unnamed protein product [Aspergillus oryzae]GMG43886.1 unnamed protein product [Aspergillus oryzae var. brunneus]
MLQSTGPLDAKPINLFSANKPTIRVSVFRNIQRRSRVINRGNGTQINGDPVPEDSSDIEFGVAVDRNDLGKGWTKLEFQTPQFDEDEAPKRGAGRRSAAPLSLQAAEIRNGQPVAFRFRKRGEETETAEELIDLELEDPGWDVVLPSLDDEEEEN